MALRPKILVPCSALQVGVGYFSDFSHHITMADPVTTQLAALAGAVTILTARLDQMVPQPPRPAQLPNPNPLHSLDHLLDGINPRIPTSSEPSERDSTEVDWAADQDFIELRRFFRAPEIGAESNLGKAWETCEAFLLDYPSTNWHNISCHPEMRSWARQVANLSLVWFHQDQHDYKWHLQGLLELHVEVTKGHVAAANFVAYRSKTALMDMKLSQYADRVSKRSMPESRKPPRSVQRLKPTTLTRAQMAKASKDTASAAMISQPSSLPPRERVGDPP